MGGILVSPVPEECLTWVGSMTSCWMSEWMAWIRERSQGTPLASEAENPNHGWCLTSSSMTETLAREWVKRLPNHVVTLLLHRLFSRQLIQNKAVMIFYFPFTHVIYDWVLPSFDQPWLRRHIWGSDIDSYKCQYPLWARVNFWDSWNW